MSAIAATVLMLNACKHQTAPSTAVVQELDIQTCIAQLTATYPEADTARMNRGIRQAAALWTTEDGTAEEFITLVNEHFAGTDSARMVLYRSLSTIMERLNESADMLYVELLRPVALTSAPEPSSVDYIMSGYSTRAHLQEDLYANKVAFICILNFPCYTLEEKNTLGQQWTRQQWAEARMGDIFTDRIPASIQAANVRAEAEAENYISAYNIYMGSVRTEDDRQLWGEDRVLLSHWNLRDELKACYALGETNHEKQEMIYSIMQRIIRQEIPASVINSGEQLWYPISNRVNIGSAEREQDVRYQKILDIFHAYLATDPYCPNMPTAIVRNFEGNFEFSDTELEQLFITLLSSPEVKKTAELIRERLGRELRPYDIWYDGFKSRSTMNEDDLSAQTRRLYPTPEAYELAIPTMLTHLGWTKEEAQEVASHIVVEPARGSGHAWPCEGRNEPSRLRTRIAPTGMDYKGYNIAVHEMGHNVEEVTSLYLIDHYMLHGIPNTGFTEASAFLFQQRDLQLLGYGRSTMDKFTILDNFWGMYEIMGVGLVDMYMWRWLYAHPEATAAELREQVLTIAADVWNRYYLPVLGEQDCVLLAVYSHMVNSPMYLPNYSIGNLVQFQLEEYLADKTDREWAQEYTRFYRQGRLTPNIWMKGAVGGSLSVEPVLKATAKCFE